MMEAEVITDFQKSLQMEEKECISCEILENSNNKTDIKDSMSNNVTSANNSGETLPSANQTKTLGNSEKVVGTSADCVLSPANETSIDDEWLDIMGSGNFKKLVLQKGLGHETRPDRGDRVTVYMELYCKDKLIEKNENLQFIVGDMDVIQALDLVVCLMEKEEIAKVKIPAKLAYGKIGRDPDIPPESDLECEIRLLEVQSIEQSSLTVSERLQLGNEKRARGNFFYERTEYLDAIYCYERAIEYLDGIRDSSGSTLEESQNVVDIKIKVYNNMAASHLKLSAYQAALKSVESVLNVQPKNVKALFRKAKILGAQGSTDEAITCLKLAASLEPETKIIQTELIKLRNQKRKEEETQKAMYKRMFPKSETKKTSSFSKVMKISAAATAGMVAVVGVWLATYRLYHS